MGSCKVRESGWRYDHVRLSLLLCLMIILHSSCLEAGDTANKGDDNHKDTSPCSGENCREDAGYQEEKCNNPDGWNLRGSEWGCCGNYDGCCTYASFVCYLHDAVCKCCDSQLCGPDCKPELECVSTTEDDDTVSNKVVKPKTSREHAHKSTKDVNYNHDTERPVAAVSNGYLSVRKQKNAAENDKLNIGKRTNDVSNTSQYQGDQGVHSKDTRTFGTDENEEGSGEADEKVTL